MRLSTALHCFWVAVPSAVTGTSLKTKGILHLEDIDSTPPTGRAVHAARDDGFGSSCWDTVIEANGMFRSVMGARCRRHDGNDQVASIDLDSCLQNKGGKLVPAS